MRKLYQVKRERLFSAVLFMFMISLVMIGCFPDDGHFDVNPDLAGRLFPQIQAEPEFSTHAKAIEMSGMEEFIGRAGLYTVYVPTNDAWQDFFDNHPTYNSLEDIPEEDLQRIVFYHAMVNMYFTFDYEEGMERFFALGGKYLTAIKNNGNLTIDSVSFDDQLFNINAENGAIHGLVKVLTPKPNFSEFAISHKNGMYSRYYTLLEEFTRREVNEDLSTPDQIVIDTISELGIDFRNEDQLATGFIFTDEAFNNWLASQPQFPTLEDVYEEILEKIMNHHFIESDPDGDFAYVLDELLNNPLEAVSGELVELESEDVEDGYIAISNGNGIAVKNLLTPPSFDAVSGYTLLNPDQDLQIFYRAMEKAGLYDQLSDTSKAYTVLAPTDEVFKAAGIDTTVVNEMTGAELQPIMQYHIIPKQILSTELTDGKVPTLLSGDSITVDGSTFMGTSGTANVLEVDITQSNGVIHKIDKVLSLP